MLSILILLCSKEFAGVQKHADNYFASAGARPLEPPLFCCVSNNY
jgi:hypothetical protein